MILDSLRSAGRVGTAAGRTALLGLVLCLGPGACSQPPETSRPHLLLVSLDTVRADHLSAYGYARELTPNLDRLAGEGVLFETVYAPMGTTSPSHATLFTSRSPLAHGLMRNGHSLGPQQLTLAERLKAVGYRCAAFVSSYPVRADFGFAQGFDHFDDEFSVEGSSLPKKKWEGKPVQGGFDRRGEGTLDAATSWLRTQDPSVPLFLWVHFFDPHTPYQPPEEYARKWRRSQPTPDEERIDRYDAEIHYVDALVGRLVEQFEAWAEGSEPLLVVTGDHGEGLFDHGHRLHNRNLYDEETRVPWLMRWRGTIPEGLRSPYPAHLIDVAPTLLSLLDAGEVAAGLDGLDLSGIVAPGRGGPEPPARAERPLWLQRPYYDRGRARMKQRGYGFGVRVGDWKLIEAREEGTRELYDLSSDPGEHENLAQRRSDIADALSRRIAVWEQGERSKGPAPQLGIRREDRAALQALGYEEDESAGSEGPPDS